MNFVENYFLFILILTFHLLLHQPVDGKSQKLKQCYPKFDNHTLCYGSGILNSVTSFSGLLRNSRSGFSILESNVWIILLHTKCHGDLERLLCTIYAPVCLKGHQFTRVQPCQELCDSVRDKCLPRMKVYGFEWPPIVDCKRFPSGKERNCIQPTESADNMSELRKSKRESEDHFMNQTALSDEEKRKTQKNCQVCNHKAPLELLLKSFCKYSLIVKAKISNIFKKQKQDHVLSIRMQHKSKVLLSSKPFRIPLTNLITEVQCNCPILQNADSVSRGKWLLMGDLENGQFIVKFLTKWQRKRKKFTRLFRELKKNEKHHCKNQRHLLSFVHNQLKVNEPEKENKEKKRINKKTMDSSNDYYPISYE